MQTMWSKYRQLLLSSVAKFARLSVAFPNTNLKSEEHLISAALLEQIIRMLFVEKKGMLGA